MRRTPVIAIAAIVLGAVIVVAKVGTDGITPSFMLLLGALMIADGVLRLLVRQRNEHG